MRTGACCDSYRIASRTALQSPTWPRGSRRSEIHRIGPMGCTGRSMVPSRSPPSSSSPRSAGLFDDPEVGLGGLPAVGEQLLGFVVVDRAGDDDVATLLPVGRCGDLV